MGASLLIALREGVEAALIVGVVLGVLSRSGHARLKRHVWMGVVSAVVLSAGAGVLLYRVGVTFSGRGEQLFEGATMLTAALLLTWMIFWMKTHGRELSRELEANAREALSVGGVALFLVAFTAVLREGLETALFLVAATFQANTAGTLGGGVIGLALAVLIGVLIFRASLRLDLKRFFNVTGLLLLFVAAGLVAHGIHEFQEAGLIPVIVEHIWDINGFINEKGVLGSFLTALFGYNGNPSLIEVIGYLTYLIVVGIAGKPRDVKAREVLA